MDISVRSETFLAEDRSWLASEHGTDAIRSVTLDLSLFTEATHYPDGHIPSGVELARVDASVLYGPYVPAATNGQQNPIGLLYTSVHVRTGGANNLGAAMFEHGFVVDANLPDANGLDAAGRDALTLIVFR